MKQIVFTPPKEEFVSELDSIFKSSKKAKKDPLEKKQIFKSLSCGSSFVYLIDGTTFIKFWLNNIFRSE